MYRDEYNEMVERQTALTHELRKLSELCDVRLIDLRQEAKQLAEAHKRIEKLEGALRKMIAGQWVFNIDDMVARARAALEDDDG